MRYRVWPAIAAALMAPALAACASAKVADDVLHRSRGTVTLVTHAGPASPASIASPVGLPPSVLREWSSFPVTAARRPLVITGSTIDDPRTGFPTGDAKLAYLGGRFRTSTALPTGPTSSDGYRLITAMAAVQTLRSQDGKVIGATTLPPPLTIVSATFDHAPFQTDRGTQSLPAWRFTFSGVTDPAYVLAVDPSTVWPRPVPLNPGNETEQVQISADHRVITLHFVGSAPGTGPCTANYTAQAYQGTTVVAVNARALPQPPTHQNTVCVAMGYARTVEIPLSRPLGNRVVIDLDGHPLTDL